MEGADGSPQPDPSEDVPHARGPPVVGIEDMGLQDGRGIEMTLSQDEGEDNLQSAAQGGGGGDGSNNQQEGKGSKDAEAEAKADTDLGAKDGDGDIELGDQAADGAATAAVGEGKESAKEETKG